MSAKYVRLRTWIDMQSDDPRHHDLVKLLCEMSVGRCDIDFEDLEDSEVEDDDEREEW